MGPSSEISDKVQEPRDHITIEEPTRKKQRRIGQHEEKAGDEKKGQALQVVQLDTADALDALVRFELLWARLRVERRLFDVFRRSEPALNLRHPKYSQP